MNTTPLIRFDWAIKYLLRDKANFDVLEGFLSAVLKRDIRILQILESESNQKEENEKFNRVDLLVENAQGEKIIIEIQNNRQVHYLERMLYGSSKLVVENLNLGDAYKKIKKVFSISILYFLLTEEMDDYVYYGKTEFRGFHNNKPLKLRRKKQDKFVKIEASTLFPEYYLIEVEKFQDVIQSDLDEWIYMLKHDAIRDDFKAKNINKAKEKLDYLKLPAKQRKDYERYMESLAMEKDMLDSAWEDGEEKGLVRGRKEGREEGRKEGTLLTAKKMQQEGFDISVIAKVTGLSAADIAKL